MGARTGSEYLKGLQQSSAEIWLGDERITDVTSHPALRGCAQSMATLYDMQHTEGLRDEMTYPSPRRATPLVCRSSHRERTKTSNADQR